MPTIIIDGKAYEVKAGNNLLEACLGLGLDLPYFCWHPAMGSVGSCRQCALVQYQNEEDTRGRIVMGCMTPVTDGARFSLNGENAREFRASVVESLMVNHPHDCPVCAEGGECHLQDMTVMTGHRDRRYRGRKNTHRNQYLGPLIHHEMNRCITCYRCVRYYRDYAGGTDLAAMACHDHIYFGRHREGVLESEFAGNLVEVCPTGVFTDKTLVKSYTRKWDLQSAPSVCVGCGLGCNTIPGERYGKLKRIHNRYNSEVNGYFLCDRGRFGGGFVNSPDRIDYAGIRNSDGTYNALPGDRALARLAELMADKKVAGIGSPRASLEANYLLRRLVGEQNYSPGYADGEGPLLGAVLDALKNSGVPTPSMKQVESADAVLILGEDVTNTAPRLALSLRQSVRNRALELADGLDLPHWQDAAVRNLAQDERSPLFIAAVTGTKLDDVAAETLSLAPPDIARLGLAVAAELGAGAPVEGLDPEQQGMAARIAGALKGAKRPLVVSGTGARDAAVIGAARTIASALMGEDRQPMLSLCVPECNSLGVELLRENAGATLEDLTKRAGAGEIDILLVLENDLYRRGAPGEIDRLLDNVEHLVVLDLLDSPTASRCDMVLAAASFAESEGTLVSSEGRAQRHYPVFVPLEGRQASWRWLSTLGRSLGKPGFDRLEHFDQIESACAGDIPALAGITGEAPDHSYRNRGLKVPRQPHRYSGRTAMGANISVHEPKQPVDDETPLAFSMEGLSTGEPASLLPFVWSPGWNSNQSLSKFQQEVGGALKGGPSGARLIEPGTATELPRSVPDGYSPRPGEWLLVPLYRIYGTEELSVRAPAIAELAGESCIALRPGDAEALGVTTGDGVTLDTGDGPVSLEVRLDPRLASGCAGFTVGMKHSFSLCAGARVVLRKAANWQRRSPRMIASDNPEIAHV